MPKQSKTKTKTNGVFPVAAVLQAASNHEPLPKGWYEALKRTGGTMGARHLWRQDPEKKARGLGEDFIDFSKLLESNDNYTKQISRNYIFSLMVGFGKSGAFLSTNTQSLHTVALRHLNGSRATTRFNEVKLSIPRAVICYALAYHSALRVGDIDYAKIFLNELKAIVNENSKECSYFFNNLPKGMTVESFLQSVDFRNTSSAVVSVSADGGAAAAAAGPSPSAPTIAQLKAGAAVAGPVAEPSAPTIAQLKAGAAVAGPVVEPSAPTVAQLKAGAAVPGSCNDEATPPVVSVGAGGGAGGGAGAFAAVAESEHPPASSSTIFYNGKPLPKVPTHHVPVAGEKTVDQPAMMTA